MKLRASASPEKRSLRLDEMLRSELDANAANACFATCQPREPSVAKRVMHNRAGRGCKAVSATSPSRLRHTAEG